MTGSPERKPTVCLVERRCLVSACKVNNKMAFAELVREKRGAEISLILRLVRSISLWALLIMSNQSKVPTWKNWLQQKRERERRRRNKWTLCVIFSSASSRQQKRAAPTGLAAIRRHPFGMHFNSLSLDWAPVILNYVGRAEWVFTVY